MIQLTALWKNTSRPSEQLQRLVKNGTRVVVVQPQPRPASSPGPVRHPRTIACPAGAQSSNRVDIVLEQETEFIDAARLYAVNSIRLPPNNVSIDLQRRCFYETRSASVGNNCAVDHRAVHGSCDVPGTRQPMPMMQRQRMLATK